MPHGDRSCGRIEIHPDEKENRSAMGRFFFRGKGSHRGRSRILSSLVADVAVVKGFFSIYV